MISFAQKFSRPSRVNSDVMYVKIIQSVNKYSLVGIDDALHRSVLQQWDLPLNTDI